MKEKKDSKYFMVYCTANDDIYYYADYLNFLNMKKYNPGIKKIYLFIAISKAKKNSLSDNIIINSLAKILKKCPWIDIKNIIIKNNIGRDFSSTQYCLNEISKIAKPNDYVMVRNRSGSGPFKKSWYKDYINQFDKSESIGLVGSTINFLGHPNIKTEGITTHVQTYVYLSSWKLFNEIYHNYPGISCTDRLQIISEGEIGLSQLFLKNGYGISCLLWPNHIFDASKYTDSDLNQEDIKIVANNIPIIYKYLAKLDGQSRVVKHPKQLLKKIWETYCYFQVLLRKTFINTDSLINEKFKYL